MKKFLTPRLALLALAHCSIDAYSSFFSPLLPLLVVKLHLSLALVGSLVALASLSSSFSQPLFGMLSDRLHRPWFVAFGPLVAAVFMCSIGLAPSYGALVALLMVGGIGAAAFHPQAAVLASEVSPRRSMAMSFFVTGGTIGFAFGPIFAVTVVGLAGLDHTWLAMIPGLVISALMLAWFRRVPPRVRHVGARPALAELRPHALPLTLLYFCVVCRSAVSYGFMTFLPIYLHRHGYSVATGGQILTVYLALGAFGGFAGGWLAERFGGRRVVIASFIGAAPLFMAFPWLPLGAGLVSLIVGQGVLQASLPVNVVLGQELSPRHSSTISSLLMGAAWGVGALLIGPIGALADQRGLEWALRVLASLLIPGLACALALPGPHRAAVAAEPGATTVPLG
jgi:FSR family fosmidomycin resistance protein-like MFS transporter